MVLPEEIRVSNTQYCVVCAMMSFLQRIAATPSRIWPRETLFLGGYKGIVITEVTESLRNVRIVLKLKSANLGQIKVEYSNPCLGKKDFYYT